VHSNIGLELDLPHDNKIRQERVVADLTIWYGKGGRGRDDSGSLQVKG
jgi:hypothetical protein